MNSEIKAVIYDMGGVILRSHTYEYRSAIAKRYGMSRRELEALIFDSPSAIEGTLGKKTNQEHWQFVLDNLNVPAGQRENFEHEFWACDQLDHGLVKFLGDLRPERKTGLLSNAWTGTRERLFIEYHCEEVFDVSLFSYEVGLAKPDEAYYQMILDLLGVRAEQAIFLDDNNDNVIAAAQMGMKGIRFRNRDQAIQEMQALL
jgi:epoxide hydrolase-like predicted phosphatase